MMRAGLAFLKKRFLRRPWQRGIAWGLGSVSSFAGMAIALKFAIQDYGFHAVELVFWRMFPAALLLALWAWQNGKRFRTPHWRLHVRRSGIGTLALLLNFQAIVLLPLSTAITLAYSSSLAMAVISRFFFRERVAARVWHGIILGFVGVCLLLRPDLSASEWQGIAVAVLSSFGAALAYLQVREVARAGEDSWRVVFYFSCSAALLCVLLNLYWGWTPIPPGAWPLLLGVSLSALLGQICLTRAYGEGDKFTVSVLSYITVLITAAFSYFYLGEALPWNALLALLLIVGAGILTTRAT